MEQKNYLFYNTLETYNSAKVILNVLSPIIGSGRVESVLDFGCGIGSWAKAFQEIGVKTVNLVDHPSIDTSRLLIKKDYKFYPVDLDHFVPEIIKVDCVVCTEVLEHIRSRRSDLIIEYLTKCSNLIIFSAAIPRQGGLGHVNEQRHLYWHEKFESHGFHFYDGFKMDLLDNDAIVYWLRQNLFVYYNANSSHLFNGRKNITNKKFELVSSYVLNKRPGLKESSRNIFNAFLARVKNLR